MKRSMPWAAACVLAAAAWIVPPAGAQEWRQEALTVGTTARVLLVGTHPEDEDNALIAWLSLGRHIETAYLSLTRGESGLNVAGKERQGALAVVRTAELLAERQRDGAHQYFTRAYDFGFTRSDSVVEAAWPHDSLLEDMVSIIRAFRPQVVIALNDSADRDATHRMTARLTREAVVAAGDTVRLPARRTSQLPGWPVSRLMEMTHDVGTPAATFGTIGIDVGALDPSNGRSYAEVGAEIRRLQRTQPPRAAPPVGHLWRLLRIEQDSDPPAGGLFGTDTSSARFRGSIPPDVQPLLDSLITELRATRSLAEESGEDSLVIELARVSRRAEAARRALACEDIGGVPLCAGARGDLAVSLDRVRTRSAQALTRALSLVIDGTVGRDLVAARDSVPVTVTAFNGGCLPIVLRRIEATSPASGVMLLRDTVLLPPDSVQRWQGSLYVPLIDFHWWQVNGLQRGTWMHVLPTMPLRPAVPQLIDGEDRIPTSGIRGTISVAGVDVPITEQPLVYRDSVAIRGDTRHPLTGVTPISVLLERAAEYERAGLPIDRLFRVYVWSARQAPTTLAVSLQLPRGLRADSATRTIVLPPFGSSNVFFRLRGMLAAGSDSLSAVARISSGGLTRGSPSAQAGGGDHIYAYGEISFDYPHIPSQQIIRWSNERLEVVDLHVPSRLRVAYVRGSDDVQQPLGQLQVNLQALDPSLLPVVDLSVFSTVLIGADALANDALAGAIPALREFARQGGTVVILPGGREVATSGLLPFPIAFDSTPGRVGDPAAEVHIVDSRSPLLRWPNRITAQDFADWSGERARGIPMTFDAHYRTVLSTADPGEASTTATVLVGRVGKGSIIYTSLSLDRQLNAVNPGAARLLVNMLSAGLERPEVP